MNPFRKLRHIVTSEKHQEARNPRNEFARRIEEEIFGFTRVSEFTQRWRLIL